MVNLRAYLFAGMLAACGGEESQNQPPEERSLQTGHAAQSQEQQEATIALELQKVICPTPKPEGLTALIIEQYRSNPAQLRSALNELSPSEQFHIYRALGDTNSARTFLKKTFRSTGITCLGYEPDIEDINQRITSLLEKSWSEGRGLDEAFALSIKTGSRERQLEVIRKYEELAEPGRNFIPARYHLKNALKFCDIIADVEQKTRLTNVFFSKIPYLKDAAKEIKKELGIEPTPAMYTARGDYWLRSKDDARFKLAFESYKFVNDIAGAQKVLQAILAEDQNVLWLPLAVDVALFLGDNVAAKNYAEDYFVEYDITGSKEIEVLQKGGSTVNPALLQRRGDYQLKQESFEQAYQAFQKANDVRGMRKVAEVITSLKN